MKIWRASGLRGTLTPSKLQCFSYISATIVNSLIKVYVIGKISTRSLRKHILLYIFEAYIKTYDRKTLQKCEKCFEIHQKPLKFIKTN